MTFSTAKNVISNDEGFSVELLMPPAVRYTEGSRSVVIDSEFLMGDVGLAIYVSTVKRWNSPDDTEAIGNDARLRIADNLRRAFQHTGRDVDIQ